MRSNGGGAANDEEDSENDMDTLRDIKEGTTELTTGSKTYKYFEYVADNVVKRVCEPFTRRNIYVNLSAEDVPRNDETPTPSTSTSRVRILTNSVQQNHVNFHKESIECNVIFAELFFSGIGQR